MKQLSAAAVERAMKLQDVILQGMGQRITWFQARAVDQYFTAGHILRARCQTGTPEEYH